MKKYIQLPKTYISYSQVQLWKHDPKRYIELYMNGRDEFRLNNTGLDYGKKVALALEHEQETGDLLTDAALLLLPKYDTRDKEIEVEVKTKDGWLKIIGRPDMLDSKTLNFREIKSGKGAWTQNKANKHPQLPFYAMLIYLKHKIVPKEIHLDWIETQDSPTGILPTGRVETFKIELSLSDVLNCLADTIRIAKEIELFWSAHIKPPEDVF